MVDKKIELGTRLYCGGKASVELLTTLSSGDMAHSDLHECIFSLSVELANLRNHLYMHTNMGKAEHRPAPAWGHREEQQP